VGASGTAASGLLWRSVVVVRTVLTGTGALWKSSGFVSLSFGASGPFSGSAEFGKTAALRMSDVFAASNPLSEAAQAGNVWVFESWKWILIAAAVLLVAACITIFWIVKRREITEPEEEEDEMREVMSLDNGDDENHEYWNPIQSDRDEDNDAAAAIANSDDPDSDLVATTLQNEPRTIPSGDGDPLASDETE
jgi:hypothetical protein